MIKAYFDGSCEPINPNGNMGIGALIYVNDKVEWTYSNTIKLGQYGFNETSNNLAEYLAFQSILTQLIEMGLKDEPICIYGDSKLVVEQMNGRWKIKHGTYSSQAIEAKKLLSSFSNVKIFWIPRERNQLADDLSKVNVSPSAPPKVEKAVESEVVKTTIEAKPYKILEDCVISAVSESSEGMGVSPEWQKSISDSLLNKISERFTLK